MTVLFGDNERRDKPRRVRVVVYRDDWKQVKYLLEAKYWFFWLSNYKATSSPKKLMQDVNNGLGMRLEDLEFVVGEGLKVPMRHFEQAQLKNDYFPFDPPKAVPQKSNRSFREKSDSF